MSIVGPDAPVDIDAPAEHPMSPQESGALKTAIAKTKDAVGNASNLGLNVVLVLAEAARAYEQLQEAEEEQKKAADRAIKSSGINRDRVIGFDLDRGMIKFTRRKKDAGEA